MKVRVLSGLPIAWLLAFGCGDSTLESDACSPNPCRNNGTCETVSEDYRCVCASGFWGQDCAFEAGAYKTVSSGIGHTCAIRNDDTVECWGHDSFGQATPPSGTFVLIDSGGDSTCGVRTDGTLACWGLLIENGLSVPTGTFIDVGVATYFACGVRENYSTECWATGDLSFPDTSGTYVSIDVGDFFSCGIKTDDTAECWNSELVETIDANIGDVSVGYGVFCALSLDGAVACVSDGSTYSPEGTFTSVSAGYLGACGLRADNTVECWREDTSTPLPNMETPTGSFVAVSSSVPYGDSVPAIGDVLPLHVCGLKSDKSIECWGDNRYGQLSPETEEP